jgi:hypothetical protein
MYKCFIMWANEYLVLPKYKSKLIEMDFDDQKLDSKV